MVNVRGMRMNRFALPALPAMLLLLIGAQAWGQGMSAAMPAAIKPLYVKPDDADWAAMLPGPPADDSPEHRAEVATLLHWQEKRTSEDVARCKAEEEVTAFVFADVLGDWFNAYSLPVTANLMHQVYVDTRGVTNAAKKKWNRVRPPLAIPEIKPCVVLEKSASYPSGHAARGIVWATILSEMFPDHREALMARGRLIGDDRFIAGMHYPSDVAAGQKLGEEIARRLLDNSDFKQELQRAKDECLAGVH
jgi:acid phosphatase (class A)